MVIITNEQKEQLNKINVAAQKAKLGEIIQEVQTFVHKAKEEELKDETNTNDNSSKIITDSYIVTAEDEKAGKKLINIDIAINGYIVQIYRKGNLLSNYNITKNKKSITISTNNKDYILTTDDVINYIVF